MPFVRVMKTPADEVVDMIPVGQRRMPASRPMDVASAAWRAERGVSLGHLNPALVEMVAVQMMQAAVVNEIDMAVVSDGEVTATLAVDMAVVAMNGVVGHPRLRLAESAR